MTSLASHPIPDRSFLPALRRARPLRRRPFYAGHSRPPSTLTLCARSRALRHEIRALPWELLERSQIQVIQGELALLAHDVELLKRVLASPEKDRNPDRQ